MAKTVRRKVPGVASQTSTQTQVGQLRGQLNNGIKPLSDMELNDLIDVRISSPGLNNVIFYDGTRWINKDIAEVMQAYVWVLDGGDADGHVEPTPPEPSYDTYAEELTYVLQNYINGDEFQSYIRGVDGLKSMTMTGNNINLSVSKKFPSIIEYVYDDDNVSMMMGRIVTAIYDNISSDIRKVMDDVETDLWLGCKVCNPGENKTFEIFVYMSDKSVVFYDINVTFIV